MFYHREKEIEEINAELKEKNRKIIIYGKRRVGKTSIIKKIMEENKCIYFECIQDTLKENLASFKLVLNKTINIPSYVSLDSFETVFDFINSLNEKYTIIFDEYPYLKKMNKSETIDSIFQKIFDNYSANLNFIICGSQISMMRELLTEGNPLFGRFSRKIFIDELNYIEASSFYENKSIMDKIAFYSLFGGSPYINSFINKQDSLENNIKNLFLNEESFVYNYADSLLISDAVNGLQAKKILSFIKNGKKRYSEIENALDLEKTGKLVKSLKSLVSIKILKKTYPINKLDDDKKAYYEINDNVLRFFYTYIYGKNSIIISIGKDNFYDTYIKDSLTTFISHRFEEIIRSYYSLLAKSNKLIGIRNIGTYYYDDSKNKQNGEFDVALEFDDYIKIIEVKYYKNLLTLSEMNKEINQIEKIKTNYKLEYAFVSTSGYEPCDYECIDIDSIYNI
jgi:uncharacterized protein